MGRYVQPDPLGLPALLSDGPNTYAYVNGNPFGYVDESGQQAKGPSFIGPLLRPLPNWARNLLEGVKRALQRGFELEEGQFRVPTRGSGKEKADNGPSRRQGERPRIEEDGNAFAQRIMDQQYGKGNWQDRGASSEYNKIKKWGQRGFEVPKNVRLKAPEA